MTNDSGILETNGARIYYEVEGTGEPVVLIHAGIADLRMWDAQVADLSDAHRLIPYDTRGFGRTETDAVPFSNRADIAALLDHVGESSAHVVGLSRGGMIALDFALEYPDRVRSLVVAADGIGGYESPEAADEAAWVEPERYLEARDWDAIAEWETAYWAEGPGQPKGRVDPSVRAKVHDWILTNYRAEKVERQPERLSPPAVGRLGELRAPLLVMIGTLDEPETQDACRHLAEAMPGARLEVFDGAAHMLNLEQPERFNRLLREFFGAAASA